MVTGLADTIDDEHTAVLSLLGSTGIAKHSFQPHGIAHRMHGLVNHDDPSISDLQRPALGRQRKTRHIDYDVLGL